METKTLRWKTDENAANVDDRRILILTLTPDEDHKKMAADVLRAQDACNLTGLANSYSAAMDKLRCSPLNVIGSEYVNQHPINHVWLDKLCDLSHIYERTTPSASWNRVYDIRDGRECEIEFQVDYKDVLFWESQVPRPTPASESPPHESEELEPNIV